ncbi:serine hydrolase domain-containing protein [Streptomyces sp. NPDC048111]|uniref:serine hydrolase domain-containing protein n=1 Tax=Streptomyces sp. NPDC048111 TaxID=3365500 RepID=UPI00372333DD
MFLPRPARPARSARSAHPAHPPRRRARLAGAAAVLAACLLATAAPAQAAPPHAAPAPTTTSQHPLDRTALAASLDAVHAAGMYGAGASVRDGGQVWVGATGVADTGTGRPMRPGMQHRVGSVTKAFTSVAVLQQVAAGRIDLDAPIARYLPATVPGERGRAITVRMLLNHTSGIGDYVLGAFPSLQQLSTKSLDDNRFRHFRPAELARLGLQAAPTGKPGEKWSYSNTNYVIAGMLLRKVTGEDAEDYITHHVIEKARLRHTYFPRSPYIAGPHPRMYESFYGLIDPPRDYSVYDMSWAGTAGALVSTTSDLEDFYRALLRGQLLPAAQLHEMQTTVPVLDADGRVAMRYGLGIYAVDLPCGRFWGHDGAVFGAGTSVLSSPDGGRQAALGFNLMKYQKLRDDGTLEPSPIDAAIGAFTLKALCGTGPQDRAGASAAPSTVLPRAQDLAPALPPRY